jgi:hypothetical protein
MVVPINSDIEQAIPVLREALDASLIAKWTQSCQGSAIYVCEISLNQRLISIHLFRAGIVEVCLRPSISIS